MVVSRDDETRRDEMSRRVNYDRKSSQSTVSAAARLAQAWNADKFVFATYLGFTISDQRPPFGQPYCIARPDGSVETVKPSFGE
jgi:hypothetical protein